MLILAVLMMISTITKVATEYTPDDAYFYLVVARNAALGIPSSFSGIDPTNGYHPLWAWLLRPVFEIVTDEAAAVRVILLLQMGMYAACVWLMVRAIPKRQWVERAFIGILFIFLSAFASWYGLESGLACLLVVVTLRLGAHHVSHAPELRRGLILGAVSGLTVLSRLDAGLMVAPLLLYVAWVDWRRQVPLWRALAPGVLSVVLVAPYLVSNWLEYGHLMPISGFIKSSFPRLNPVNYPLFNRRWARLLLPLLLAAVAQLIAHRRAPQQPEQRRVVTLHSMVLVGICLFYCYELLFQLNAEWALFSWHFAASTAAACVLLAHALTLFARPVLAGFGYGGVALAALAMLVLRFAPGKRGDGGLIDVLHAARWVASSTPPNTRVATTDSGIIAYYGHRPTINLDGLINNFEYQDVLRAGKLASYLTERKVEYVIITGRALYNWRGGCYCAPVDVRNSEHDSSWLCFDEHDLAYRTPGSKRRQGRGRTAAFHWPPAHFSNEDSRQHPQVEACAAQPDPR